MNAGDKVIMEFSDGTSGPVPVRDIALYKKQATDMGGWARVKGTGSGMMGQIMPHQIATSIADWLPAAGSIGGSITGGVLGAGAAAGAGPAAPAVAPYTAAAGRVAGGIAGGAIGKAAQEAVYRHQGYLDAPGTVAGEAAVQAAMGPVGEVGGSVLSATGRGVMRSALTQKAGQGLKVVGEMVKERIPVGGARTLFGKTVPSTAKDIPVIGPLLVRGSNAATSHFERRLASRNAVNAAASAAGVRIPRQVAEDAITSLSGKIRSEMGSGPELAFLKKRLAEWKRRKATHIDPREIQSIITRFDAKSKPIFAALERGENVPSAGMQASAAYMKQVSDALRGVMRSSVPGLEAENAKLGAASAVRAAVNRSEAIPTVGRMLGRGTVGAGIGGAIGGAMSPDNRMKGAAEGSAVGGLLSNNPATLSRLGLLMTDPALLALVRQSPRFLAGQNDR